MFYSIFCALCDKKGKSPYKAITEIGLNRSIIGKYKKGSEPHGPTLKKICDFFDVSSDFLLGRTPESFLLGTEYQLAQVEKEYEAETDAAKKADLAIKIDLLRESIEDQRFSIKMEEKKKAALDCEGREADEFLMAAHKYSGRLSQKDKKVILQMMKTLAEDVESAAEDGSTE